MPISRRELLKSVPFALGGAAISSCAGNREISQTPVPVEYPPQELVHRAASIELRNRVGKGHSSLVSIDGRLHLYTIEHVVEMLHQDPEQSIAVFPFLTTGRLDLRKFTYANKKWNDKELAAFYPIGSEMSGILQQAIQQGVTTSLVLSDKTPSIGELVASPRPDTGRHTLLQVLGKDRNYNYITMRTVAGVVCEDEVGERQFD